MRPAQRENERVVRATGGSRTARPTPAVSAERSRAKPDLSLVVPAYNEKRRIGTCLGELHVFAQNSGLELEVVVVDDGSNDDTVAIARSVAQSSIISLKLIPTNHRGKGAAVRTGMAHTTGRVVGYCDVDMSAGSDAIVALYDVIIAGADMAMASRGLPESLIEVRQPLPRQWGGKMFNLLLRRLTDIPFRDTQCGLKLFREDAARVIFIYQRLDGFAFDSELAVIATKLGYQVEEVPIRWMHCSASKVSMLRDPYRMSRDLVRIVRRTAHGDLRQPGVPSKSAIDQMARAEENHWWHVSKRELVKKLMNKHQFAFPLLDLGCGGGALLAELRADGLAVGVDSSQEALTHAREKGISELVAASIDVLPFNDGTFAGVLMLDVLEHHPDPVTALSEVRRVLRPGGRLLVTVPAFGWMWSYADDVMGHYRRYGKEHLRSDLEATPFTVDRMTYFFSWLVPVAWIFRRVRGALGRGNSADDFLVPERINRTLLKIARAELGYLQRRDLPLGLSLLAIARR